MLSKPTIHLWPLKLDGPFATPSPGPRSWGRLLGGQEKSKDAIMAAGNTELCEIINVEPKLQCKACLKHWSAGIMYCTCGHLMTDDSAENKKYISAVLDLFSIPNFYIRKGRPQGHRYGKKEGCKEYHTANQLQKKCREKKYDNIHDRFIRDKTFRKAMIELGRSEKIIMRWVSLQAKTTLTSSSWWQWQRNWWESDYENSPQRWIEH